MNRLIIKTRPQVYYILLVQHIKSKSKKRYFHYHTKEEVDFVELEKEGWKKLKERFTTGTEIVKESKLCGECYNNEKK